MEGPAEHHQPREIELAVVGRKIEKRVDEELAEERRQHEETKRHDNQKL
jgi:hypothetical protein